MPILHQYQDKTGWFIRTVIKNFIITFQLTVAGVKRLQEAGVEDGMRFRRAILFDLWRQGDAYTHGTGPGVIEPYAKGQLEIDFSNDPEPATIFTGCSSCGSLSDLHLVEVQKTEGTYGELYCAVCRRKSPDFIDTSIPLALVTRGVFLKILELKGFRSLDKNALDFKESLEKAFKNKWDQLAEQKIRTKRGTQKALFEENGREKKLV